MAPAVYCDHWCLFLQTRCVLFLNFEKFYYSVTFTFPSCSVVFLPEYLHFFLGLSQTTFTNADRAVWSHVDGLRCSWSDPLDSSTPCFILTRSRRWLRDVCRRWPVDPTAGPPPWLSLRIPALPPLPHQAGTGMGNHWAYRGPSLWTRGLHGALLRPVHRLRPLPGWCLRGGDCRSTEDVSQWDLPAQLYGQSSCTQEPGWACSVSVPPPPVSSLISWMKWAIIFTHQFKCFISITSQLFSTSCCMCSWCKSTFRGCWRCWVWAGCCVLYWVILSHVRNGLGSFLVMLRHRFITVPLHSDAENACLLFSHKAESQQLYWHRCFGLITQNRSFGKSFISFN